MFQELAGVGRLQIRPNGRPRISGGASVDSKGNSRVLPQCSLRQRSAAHAHHGRCCILVCFSRVQSVYSVVAWSMVHTLSATGVQTPLALPASSHAPLAMCQFREHVCDVAHAKVGRSLAAQTLQQPSCALSRAALVAHFVGAGHGSPSRWSMYVLLRDRAVLA